MAVSTIASALGKTGGINEESQKIINKLNGFKSAEEMIQEYFGLRKEVVYSDDGQSVVDMINEFRDPEVLKRKKVKFVPYFESKGMTREMFDKAVPVQFQTVTPTENVTEPGNIVDGSVETEPAVPSPRKWTGKRKK